MASIPKLPPTVAILIAESARAIAEILRSRRESKEPVGDRSRS